MVPARDYKETVTETMTFNGSDILDMDYWVQYESGSEYESAYPGLPTEISDGNKETYYHEDIKKSPYIHIPYPKCAALINEHVPDDGFDVTIKFMAFGSKNDSSTTSSNDIIVYAADNVSSPHPTGNTRMLLKATRFQKGSANDVKLVEYVGNNKAECISAMQTYSEEITLNSMLITVGWTNTGAGYAPNLNDIYIVISYRRYMNIYAIAEDKALVKINPHIVTERLDVDWLGLDSYTIPANRIITFRRWNTFPDNVTSLASFTFNDEDGNAYVPETKFLYISVQIFAYAKNNTPGYESANHSEIISVYNTSNNPVTIYGINLFYNRLINE